MLDPNAVAHEDVVRLELELLRPEVRADADRTAALLDPEFTEIGASGRLWNREEILASLAQEPADGPPITAKDVTTVEVAEGVVLVRWVSLREGRRARRSSLWRRTDEGWRMLFHQGTLSDA